MKSIFYTILVLFGFALFSFPLNSQYWQKIQNIPTPFNNNYWLDVFFHPSNSNYGWICGFNGMIIRTTDGGNTWRGSTVNAYHLESIHFPTLQIGYVSGIEGIFKSTDGGANWFDVTPTGARDTTFFWGCYFLNENYGVLVGDGCYSRSQHFWLTTDGGNSWSVFLGTESNSGMTDAMLYPNGLGFASSSGKIWITQDSGRTWEVFATSGPNLWQEEITNIGSSFLVPYSGTTCTGGGNDGGMRFSTNNGSTWNSFRTGVPMFGTFLISSQKGWACGYYSEIYYTSNGGINWTKRNCGIQSGNLDDLWFIDENNGWVVGEGVFKLSNPIGTVNKNSLNFSESCVGSRKYDTIWIKNLNFSDVSVGLSLNSASNEFEIVSPGSTGYIQSCDSMRIIISFYPKTSGNKNATLVIQYPFQNPINIPISGRAIESSAKLVDTLIIINNAKCGFSYTVSAKISVMGQGEFVANIIPNIESKIIKLTTLLPLQLDPSKSNILNFEITPFDTGWHEIIYRIRFSPCDTVQFLKIRVYSVSPIINLDSVINVDFQCDVFPLKLRIFNSGNDTLFFRKFSFSPPTNKLILQGWTSGNSLLGNFILPGKDDTLIISIDPNFLGNISTNLLIENNDLRVVNRQRNIVQVKINIRIFISEITAFPEFIDFGKVCVGKASNRFIILHNKGNLEELFLNVLQRNKDIFYIKNLLPLSVKSNDSLKVNISFSPIRIGKFTDTLVFYSFYCKDTIKIICVGEGVKIDLTYLPQFISLQIQKGLSKEIRVEFHNSANDTLEVDSIIFKGEIENLIVSYLVLNGSKFNPKDTSYISFTFKGNQKGRYSGLITLHFKGTCDTIISLPVQIDILEKNLIIEPNFVNFGDKICDKAKQTKHINIKNLSETLDTILNISIIQNNSQFLFESYPPKPLILKPYETFDLKVGYLPTLLGYDTAFVQFEFEDTTRNYSIPLFAFYGRSNLSVSTKTFNFGNLEYCEVPISISGLVTNGGNVADSIIIIKEFGNSIFNFYLSKLVLQGEFKDTSQFDITVVNGNRMGVFSDTLVLGFAKCPQYDTIIVYCSILPPNFKILPQFIDLGNIWVGDTKSDKILISNNGSDVLGVKLISFHTSENVHFDTSFAKNLQSYGFEIFNFQINAIKEGEFWDTLCFEISSRCKYYACIVIHYKIPKEQYSLTFKIGRYTVKPGEDVEIKLENLTPNEYLKITSMDLIVTFDKWLFYPQLCKIEGLDVESELSLGIIKIKLKDFPLIQFLNYGKPISILGKTLYSFPDSTSLKFGLLSFSPLKEINVNFIDGLLKVFPVCQPIGSLRLEIFPSFELLGFSLENGETKIILESNEAQEIEVSFYDVVGNLIIKSETSVNKGVNVIDFCEISNRRVANADIFVHLTNGWLRKIIFVPIIK